MFLIRIVLFPLRLLLAGWYRLRNIRRPGNVLFHQVPDQFTMLRPSGLLSMLIPRQEYHFYDYLALIELIRKSGYIRKLVLFVPPMQAGWNQIEQIGRGLQSLRESKGMEIIACCDGGNLKTLYIMSFADRRLGASEGSFYNNLPGADSYFFKNALARVGIAVETYSAGKFKAQGFEMLTRSNSSPAGRQNQKQLIQDLRGIIEDRLQNAVGLDEQHRKQVVQLIRKRLTFDMRDLVRSGYVHAQVSPERFRDFLFLGKESETASEVRHFLYRNDGIDAESGELAETKSTEPTPAEVKAQMRAFRRQQIQFKRELKAEARLTRNLINERQLAKRYQRSRYNPFRFRNDPMLALVNLEGPITMGRPGDDARPQVITAYPYRDILRALRDSSEEAVFLNINSPGGSADASELLFEAIYALSRIKPVYALVGGVCASGGYYLACAANRIYVPELSINGSIGVIRIRPNLKKMYDQWGIKKEVLFPQPERDLLSEAGPISAASQKRMRAELADAYRLFLKRVCRGRELDQRVVHKMAEGQVWSGRRFRTGQMADGHETFIQVIDEYRRNAGHPDSKQFRLNLYPESKTDVRTLLGERMPSPFSMMRVLGADLPRQVQDCLRVFADAGQKRLFYNPYLLHATIGSVTAHSEQSVSNNNHKRAQRSGIGRTRFLHARSNRQSLPSIILP
ncbi:MAG: S49 family peptidase [Leptospiraceae bacterium]|nr:S49 family peptidase [Leptospiraceae bacterium]